MEPASALRASKCCKSFGEPTGTREEVDNGYDGPQGLRPDFRRARGGQTHPAGGICCGRDRESVNRVRSCRPRRQPMDEAGPASRGEPRSLLLIAGTSREIHFWRHSSGSVKGAADAGHSRSSDSLPDDGRDWKQGHCTGTAPSPCPARAWHQVSPARSKSPRNAGSGVSPVSCRLLHSRVLLAPPCRVSVRNHPDHPRGVLAGEVSCQHGAGRAQSTRFARRGLAGRNRLGMRFAQAGTGRDRVEAGAMAARR